jgi:hypothetical protein
MKKLLFLFALSTAAFGQGAPYYPISGGGSQGSGGAQVISALSYSPSDTTIVATWYTAAASSSALTCGSKAAVDNVIQPNSTFHQAIVTGLTAATLYSCAVTSGATTSSAQNVTTNAAQTRTPITTVSYGSPTITNVSGDSLFNCVSNDNKTYIEEDDGRGFVNGGGGTPNAGANMQIGVLTAEGTLTGTLVNLLTNYGGNGTSNGTDGPSGAALSNKLNGLFCMGGSLYAFESRNYYGATGHTTQQVYSGNIMRSNDHGVTWNSWQNPTQTQTNGTPPNPLGSYQFATAAYAWCSPVRYGLDDGSNGYLTSGNRIDGADAFVYVVCTDATWNNSSNLYLFRMTRASMLQNPGAPQYWHGPGSPAATDFVNDANWTSSATSATAIYTATNQTSAPDLTFIPAMNYYLLSEWYQPDPTVPSNSVWKTYAGPTPAGPWTQVGTQTNNPSGWYNPVVMHRTAAANTTSAYATVTLAYAGDYGAGQATYYFPTYSTLTLNNPPLVDAIGAGTPTFAGSAAHQLKTSYVGPLVRIQRASDSTQSDVGQNANGTINQTTITAFCSGTTCNVAKLYDQSGGGHDAVQATFANMPVIYTGGAVVVNGANNQPSMLWDNTSRWLASSITFAGTAWEGIGVLALNSTSTIQFAGAFEMTNGTASGGSANGLYNLLDLNTTPNVIGANAAGSGTAAQQTVTSNTQFMSDTLAQANNTQYLAINGGSFTNTSGTSTGTVAATVLDIGTDLPATTYFWHGNISDFVIYSGGALTTPQRATAHSVESAFFGTP